MSQRAIINARVRTDDQRGNYSIPTQIAECRKYLDGKGYALVGDHYVNVESGQDCTNQDGAIPAFVDDFSSLDITSC